MAGGFYKDAAPNGAGSWRATAKKTGRSLMPANLAHYKCETKQHIREFKPHKRASMQIRPESQNTKPIASRKRRFANIRSNSLQPKLSPRTQARNQQKTYSL